MATPSELADLAAARLDVDAASAERAQAGQEDVDGDDLAPIDWLYRTATLEAAYVQLGVTLLNGLEVPVAPVWLDPAGTFVFALPARVAPWLPSHLVRLGDMGTGVPSEDGQCTAVALARANPSAAYSLNAIGLTSLWALDQRWPAAESLCAVDVEEDVPLPPYGGDLPFDASNALPPSEYSVSPQELDAILGGAFLQGPWIGYSALVYPPPEPEEAGVVTGPDSVEVEAEPEVPSSAPRGPPLGTIPVREAAGVGQIPQTQRLPAFPGGTGQGSRPALAGSAAQVAAIVPVPATDTDDPGGASGGPRGRAPGRLPSGAAKAPAKAGRGRAGSAHSARGASASRAAADAYERLAANQEQLQMALVALQSQFEAMGPGHRRQLGLPSPLAGDAAASTEHALARVAQIAGVPPERKSPQSMNVRASAASALTRPFQSPIVASPPMPPPAAPPASHGGFGGFPAHLVSAPPPAAPLAPGARPTPPQRGASVGFPKAAAPGHPPLSPLQLAAAKTAYAQYHQVPPDYVTSAMLESSALGTAGWAARGASDPAPLSGAADPAGHGMAPEVTALVQALKAAFPSRQPVDPLTALATGGSPGDAGEPGARLAGARGAAVQEVYRRYFDSNPGHYAGRVRERIGQARGIGPWAQDDARRTSATEFFTEQVPFPTHAKTLTYFAFGVARAFDQMSLGLWVEAEDTLAKLMVVAEQTARSDGKIDFGWVLAHLPDPPWNRLLRPGQHGAHDHFALLSDPAWVAAAIGYLKDAQSLREMAQPRRGGGGEEKEKAGKENPKVKPKGDKAKAKAEPKPKG
jgi:hypothetical protein